MGSWSVSCGISNIAITSGNKCVLVPLRENKSTYGYFQYIPLTVPIFGEYDDYGGIENIEKNDNTELIEKVTGVSIEEFCEFLVDGKYTYARDEYREIKEKINNPEAMDEVRFMWIDRKVYDFMSSNPSKSSRCRDIGHPCILKALGFEKQKEKAKGRYYQIWQKDGVNVHSDGTWIQTEKGKTIYHIDSEYYKKYDNGEGNLSKHFNLSDEELTYENRNIFSYHETMDEKDAKKHLLRLIGLSEFTERFFDLEVLLKEYEDNEEMQDTIEKVRVLNKKDTDIFTNAYCKDIMKFKKDLAGLGIFYGNLHCMSGNFRPHELYLTPQCGEHAEHQILLDKFSEINKSYIDEDDE